MILKERQRISRYGRAEEWDGDFGERLRYRERPRLVFRDLEIAISTLYIVMMSEWIE